MDKYSKHFTDAQNAISPGEYSTKAPQPSTAEASPKKGSGGTAPKPNGSTNAVGVISKSHRHLSPCISEAMQDDAL